MLFDAPPVETSGDFPVEGGITPIFFQGAPYQGNPTKVFAWLGVPKSPGNGKLPAVVLVHGGGGTAYRDWVKLWMDRGYAAIAIDHCGTVPEDIAGFAVTRRAHPHNGGSQFAEGGFSDLAQPLEDQWFFHAVAAITRAQTVLRSLPEVDPKRIGLVGISWGGVLSLITAGVDDRFAFVVSVYGCGFLGENSSWLGAVMQITPPDQMKKWVELWDPAQYGKATRMPVLFCNGTNDFHFRPDSWAKTYRGISGPVSLSLKTSLPHGHPPEGDPQEITVFADSMVKGGKPLPKVVREGKRGEEAWMDYESATPIKKSALNYTIDSGDWPQRTWVTLPAEHDVAGRRVSAKIPADAVAYYLSVEDSRSCVISSALQILGDPEPR